MTLQNYSRNANNLKSSTSILFKERSTQSIKKREQHAMNYTMASGMTTERLHSGLPSSRNNQTLKKAFTQESAFNDKGSASPSTFEKKELRKSVSKDLKAVQKRKTDLEIEKQEKLKQKIQKKDVKILSIQSKRVEQEKLRKETHVIQEKTLKIKPRLYDDSRPNLQKTPKECTNTILNQKKDGWRTVKTPLG
mmetsp:Transcript_7621/g.6988  ORF Transcript_7621/g.6988 Transcript_7621/m.6988 type:complete len:193 (+) Transcript_7621:1239-1817(+)